MDNHYKLEKNEAICIILIIMINKLILNIPYYIVDVVGSGAIINILYIGIIDFIFLLVIIKLFNKFQTSDIIDISEFVGGKILKTIVGIISIAVFLLVSLLTLLNFSNVLHTIYFSNFTMIYILLFFIIGITIANLVGLKSISRTTCFVIPFAILSVLITFFAIAHNFNEKNLTPILGKNLHSTFVLGASNTFAMYIIVYFYFINPLLKNNKDYKKVSIISYFISLVLLLLTVASMLTLFNTDSDTEPINSLFLLSRQIEFGTFIQRVDALFILLWIMSIFCYLSVIVYTINKILKKLTNVSNEKMLTFSTCSILFGLTLIPFNISHLHFIEDTIYKYILLGFMFGLGLIILIIANIKKKRKNSSNINS